MLGIVKVISKNKHVYKQKTIQIRKYINFIGNNENLFNLPQDVDIKKFK